MTTTTEVTTNPALKPALTWSALAIVVAGFLWAMLYEKGQSLLGLVAFLVAVIVLIVGLRKPVVIVPIVTLVALIAASVAVAFAL